MSLSIRPGPVTTVTLNRPEVRNAFNEDLIRALSDWARGVPDDGSVRVALLAGAGPTFSAGADLQWMARMKDASEADNLADARGAALMFHLLDTLPVPLVCRVQGAALGGGAGLAAVSDVVVAAESAVFGFTEVRLGILPAMISPYVVRKIGLSAAREWCLTGERFPAATAKAMGLVHAAVPAPDLDAEVDRYVRMFLQAAPSAVRATKQLLSEVAGRRPADVLALTAAAIARQRVSPEGQEGMDAFLGRRAPRWVADPPPGASS